MACVPIEQHAYELGPRDYLNQYLHIMSQLRGGTRYFPLLLSKAHDALPRLIEPTLPRALPSSIEGHFESLDGSTDRSPSQELEFESFESAFAPPTHKSEYGQEIVDPIYATPYSLIRDSASPVSIAYVRESETPT